MTFKQTRLLSCIVFLYERSMYPFHSSVARRQRLTEGVSEAWCFKKLFELFDSIIISAVNRLKNVIALITVLDCD